MAFLVLTVFLTSCNKSDNGFDSFSDTDWEATLDLTTDGVEAEADELDAEYLAGELGLRGPCFTLVFPVKVQFPDSTTADANTLEELKTILGEWKANATPGSGRPHLVLPFEVETADGDVVLFESLSDLKELKKDCVREKRHRAIKKCFDLVYPVTLVLPNGDTVEIEDRQAMKTLIKKWARGHRGHDARPKIQLPFQVELEDGSILDITSKDDLIAAIKDCRG